MIKTADSMMIKTTDSMVIKTADSMMIKTADSMMIKTADSMVIKTADSMMINPRFQRTDWHAAVCGCWQSKLCTAGPVNAARYRQPASRHQTGFQTCRIAAADKQSCQYNAYRSGVLYTSGGRYWFLFPRFSFPSSINARTSRVSVITSHMPLAHSAAQHHPDCSHNTAPPLLQSLTVSWTIQFVN